MTTDRLKEHYDSKYVGDGATNDPPPVVPLRMRRPVGRYEGACASLPDRLPSGADILELGAGDGQVAHSLAVGGADFASYTLGDISQPRLTAIERRLTGDRYRYRHADADDVTQDLQDRYDAVVMIALIEHLVDPMRSMQAIREIVKPGGFVYIDTPNIAKWTRRIKLLGGRFPSTASADEGLLTYMGEPADLHDEGHLHYFTFRSLTKMLTERCGFSRVEPAGYLPEVKPFGRALGTVLAQRRPQLFSELACFAYA